VSEVAGAQSARLVDATLRMFTVDSPRTKHSVVTV